LPEQFGKYTVLRHLASGGMADVFLARASGIEGFEKLVVIKRIRRELSGNPEITDLFLHEARLAATLDHPNIANTYDVGKVEDSYFFTMEYVHGADLRMLLREATLKHASIPLPEAIYVATAMCAALHYAHEKTDARAQPLGIIHRDVSPSNVLLSYDGSVKVCDFGIAKAANRTSETANGVMRGKASYMSPEQCRGEPLDRRSDVFSIAIVLYEITTTRKLFRGKSEFEVMQQVVERPVTPPSQVCAGYPPELERIVMKGLEKDPARRYPTAQALQIELETFAREHMLTLSPVALKGLMTTLFAEKIEAWQRAQQGGKALGEHLLEDTANGTGRTPVTDFDGELAPRPSTLGTSSRRRRPWFPLAACAAAAALFAWGQIEQRGTDAALQAEAERLAAMVDGEVRALSMRADATAATPMLRAAVGTDAATVKDMAILKPEARQVVELFQWRGGRAASLWRVPSSEPSLTPLRAREVRVARAGRDLVITTAAQVTPLYAATDLDGSLVIASRVDLEGVRNRLAQRLKGASLRGLGDDLVLAGAGGNADQSIVLPITDKAIPRLELAVIFDGRAGWTGPAGAGCGILAMLLFIVYLLEQRRTRSV
jgi:serine/threonine protein kinase